MQYTLLRDYTVIADIRGGAIVMSRKLLFIFAFCVLVMFFGTAEAERVRVSDDGSILQICLAPESKSPVTIDMTDVFKAYPEHSGVYGILYATDRVEINPLGSSAAGMTGRGVIEFSFPGATGCRVIAYGKVYGYFLPVPYLRISAAVSGMDQQYDTAYVTQTALRFSERHRMFMLMDPHVYTYCNSVLGDEGVHKKHSILGMLEGEYAYLNGNDCQDHYSFVSDNPVLVQLSAKSRDAYQRDHYHARPLFLALRGNNYQVWTFRGFRPAKGLYDSVDRVFKAAFAVAKEEFLATPVADMDPVLMVLLDKEMDEDYIAAIAHSEPMKERVGFWHTIFAYASDDSDYAAGLYAHEIGHLVQSASLANPYLPWFSEGFADFFANKVMQRLGNPPQRFEPISRADFGIVEEFRKGPRAVAAITAVDPHQFGRIYMLYLEETYGRGFYKKASAMSWDDRYRDRKESFATMVRSTDPVRVLTCFRQALGDRVFTGFPEYIYANQRISGQTPKPTGIPDPVSVRPSGTVDPKASGRNYLTNPGFEMGSAGWTFLDISTSQELNVQENANNALTGVGQAHFWCPRSDGVLFRIEQKVDNLPAGNYQFSISIMGGDAGFTDIYAYAAVNGRIVGKAPMRITEYLCWDTAAITSFPVKAGESVTVGVYVRCSDAGAWGVLDDAYLVKVK